MLIIGENLNIMSRKIGEALKQMDPAPVRDMAEAETKAGVDLIDLNLGPIRKGGPELMEWVVRTVQEVTDLPLSLDTSNSKAIEAGLKVCRNTCLINSISARRERMELLMPIAKRYNAPFIAMTVGTEGIPRDANERGLLAAELLAKTAEYTLPEEAIWFDPVLLPVNTQQMQLAGCMEFVMMLPELAPNSKSTCGLSNISNGAPYHLKGILTRTYVLMLMRYGFYSAIADAFDAELRAIVKGQRPELEKLVHAVMDGAPMEMPALSKEEADYVKTARVLLGQTLYSDSWLEL
jgi:5-methyltetrahydrofolate corrinoid/iron sulfur protein methyltransferase